MLLSICPILCGCYLFQREDYKISLRWKREQKINGIQHLAAATYEFKPTLAVATSQKSSSALMSFIRIFSLLVITHIQKVSKTFSQKLAFLLCVGITKERRGSNSSQVNVEFFLTFFNYACDMLKKEYFLCLHRFTYWIFGSVNQFPVRRVTKNRLKASLLTLSDWSMLEGT